MSSAGYARRANDAAINLGPPPPKISGFEGALPSFKSGLKTLGLGYYANARCEALEILDPWDHLPATRVPFYSDKRFKQS